MILASLPMKFLFAILASLATKFVCKTQGKRVLLQNFLSVRLVRSDSCYEISVCETRKSHKNLARISKSDSRVNPTPTPSTSQMTGKR
jgi:hypothetical protein